MPIPRNNDRMPIRRSSAKERAKLYEKIMADPEFHKQHTLECATVSTMSDEELLRYMESKGVHDFPWMKEMLRQEIVK